MPTVKLIEEGSDDLRIQAVFADIKATRKITKIPAIWQALANDPISLEMHWLRVKTLMSDGALPRVIKEMIAVAVSVTNGCDYCINSHLTAAENLGMTDEQRNELFAVIGLYNQFNALVQAYQLEPDTLPKAARE
jgi:AhpD family alkylhydroperoxidase